MTKRKAKSRRRLGSPESEDRAQRRKFKKGGRIEAYTLGDALKSKRWP